MGREATKASGNPWYEARKKAAEYDDRLCSREGAAERLGMSVSAVADAELGLSKCMPVDKAVLMADLYRAPHLLNHYCLHECPIGCRHSLSDEVLGIDRVTVKLLKSLKVDKGAWIALTSISNWRHGWRNCKTTKTPGYLRRSCKTLWTCSLKRL